ncbi:MAG TPA: ATP-binding protein [Clostridia bacterium]|nr:ATP-binding protein [Clostridia bacterium]
MESHDRITITLPCKAEYVSVARLTASGVANRAGFDIDTVEDIKVSVSEVCSRIIGVAENSSKLYVIEFGLFTDKLVVNFSSDIKKVDCIFQNDEDGLGMSIINAFMDSVEYCPENKSYMLSMTKKF